MATRNIVPRANNEGKIGTAAKRWLEGYFGKLTIQPTSDGNVFEIKNASGITLFTVNTSTNTITAASGVKFAGDGSLLTGVTPAGVGGASATGNLELTADSDSNGLGDIIFKIGTKEVFRIPNTYASALPTGIAGNYILKTVSDNVSAPTGGYILDGTDDYVVVSDNDNLDFGYNPFTVCIHYQYKLGSTNDDSLLRKVVTSGYNIINRSDGIFQVILYKTDGTQLSLTLSSAEHGMIVNNWYYVNIVRDGDNLSVYINGELKKSGTGFALGYALSTDTLKIGYGDSASKYVKGTLNSIKLFNRAFSASEIVKFWNNGKPESSQLPYEDRNANNTNLIANGNCELNSDWTAVNSPTVSEQSSAMAYSGTYSWHGSFNNSSSTIRNSYVSFSKKKKFRVTGKIYVVSGLVKVAAQESGGSYSLLNSQSFNASASWQDINFEWTHTSLYDIWIDCGHTSSGEAYIDDMSVVQIGCVAEYLPNYAGKFGWLETQNRLHGSTSGSPVTASAGLFEHYKDVKLSVTGHTTLTNVVPKEYRLKGILFNNTTANTVVINVGTSGGGTDVVNAQSVPAGLTFVSLAKIFSLTADQTLYISSSNWNSASVNVELSMSRY